LDLWRSGKLGNNRIKERERNPYATSKIRWHGLWETKKILGGHLWEVRNPYEDEAIVKPSDFGESVFVRKLQDTKGWKHRIQSFEIGHGPQRDGGKSEKWGRAGSERGRALHQRVTGVEG